MHEIAFGGIAPPGLTMELTALLQPLISDVKGGKELDIIVSSWR